MKRGFLVLIILIIVFGVGVGWCLLFKEDNGIYTHLYSHANKHSELKISDITNFEWDHAYIDYQHYGNGEDIKQKYNLECNLETLETDYSFRIIFFKNKELIREERFNHDQLSFKGDIDMFDNSTVFSVDFETDAEKENPILVLTSKQ